MNLSEFFGWLNLRKKQTKKTHLTGHSLPMPDRVSLFRVVLAFLKSVSVTVHRQKHVNDRETGIRELDSKVTAA